MHSREPYAADGAKRKKRRYLATESLESILNEILNSESGIKKVILVDRTGLTIASVSKFSYFPADVDGIGSIASAVFYVSEEQGKALELGDLEVITSEFTGGKIFSSGCGPKDVLALISDPDINIGLIRLILKRSRDKLKETLDDFLSDIPDFDDNDRFPYPYVYKPPEPPDDIAPAFQTQRKVIEMDDKSKAELDCPYCGNKLPKGHKYCPICGKDVF